MAFSTPIFDDYEISSVLTQAWMKRKAEVEAERLQPYADILLESEVLPYVLKRKSIIFAAMKDKCETATHPSELEVPIWSFNHTFDVPKGMRWAAQTNAAAAEERGDPDALKVQQIHKNGWLHTMKVMAEDTDYDEVTALWPESLWSIIKKTDFLNQLALNFGRSYRVSLSPEDYWVSAPDGTQYCRTEFTLMLNFYPTGLPKNLSDAQNAFVEKISVRERRGLAAGESLVIWRGACLPCHEAPPASFHHFCYCGCEESDAE